MGVRRVTSAGLMVGTQVTTPQRRISALGLMIAYSETSKVEVEAVMGRTYTTVARILEDMEIKGILEEARMVRYIREASQAIDRLFKGYFIPVTETRYFDGSGEPDLRIDPLLAATALTQDGTAVLSTQWLLYPRARRWENGPYTRIRVDPDATALSVWTGEEDIVAITGRWGLYERTRSTGAAVSSQNDSDTSLVVDNAAGISPGAVLLIGAEQELVAATGSPSASGGTLGETLTASDEDVTVSSGALFNRGEVIRVDFEQMRIRDILANRLLVERGYNGTAKTTHASGATIYVYRTFVVERGANGTTAASHGVTAISAYVPPDDIGFLCAEIAGLMYQKARTGWSGRAGGADMGETFFYKIFPLEDIKRIRENYRIVAL